MMRISRIEHTPAKVLFDYFERAVEELGLKAWAILLRPGNEQQFQKKIESQVYRTLESRSWEREQEKVLSDPDKYLRWETRENPEDEIEAHYRLQAAILATLMGDGRKSSPLVRENGDRSRRNPQREQRREGKGLRTLAAQLVIEHMNRKLEVSYFLGNLTGGKVGSPYAELPTKAQILQWVSEIGQVQLTYRLGEIARFKYQGFSKET